MATSLANARKLMSQAMGDFREETTTAGGSASSLVCSTLGNKGDTYYKNWFVAITSGDASGNKRQVNTFTQSSGTIVPYVNFSATPGSAKTFELHNVDPTEKDTAIKKACREAYPHLRKEIIDKTLIWGNALPNAHFEDWASASNPDNWAVSNITSAANTTAGNYRGGAKSAALTRAGTDGHLFIGEDQWPELLTFENTTVTFKAWCKSSVASQMRLQIYTKTQGGTETTTSGTYHTGGGEFELLKVESVAIPDNLSDIEFRIRVETSNTVCYADNARTVGGGFYSLKLPTQFVEFPTEIWYHGDCDEVGESLPWRRLDGVTEVDDGSTKKLMFNSILAEAKIILKGYGYLTQPTLDSDTIEVDEPDVNALVALALYWLYRSISSQPARKDSERIQDLTTRWSREWQRLKPVANLVLPVGL